MVKNYINFQTNVPKNTILFYFIIKVEFDNIEEFKIITDPITDLTSFIISAISKILNFWILLPIQPMKIGLKFRFLILILPKFKFGISHEVELKVDDSSDDE